MWKSYALFSIGCNAFTYVNCELERNMLLKRSETLNLVVLFFFSSSKLLSQQFSLNCSLERLRQKLFQKPPATNHGSSSLIEPVSLTNDSQGRDKEFKINQS